MSRIGKMPIQLPAGVGFSLDNGIITIKGPKGSLSLSLRDEISVEEIDNTLLVKRKGDDKIHRALHGLYRSLINNMVIGVTKGFEKQLEIQGIGYKAKVQGKKLILNLGFWKPVEVDIPEGIKVTVEEKTNIITLMGIDKQQVGQFAAYIRSLKKVEPYKGKGIRYVGEYVRKKVGKSGAK